MQGEPQKLMVRQPTGSKSTAERFARNALLTKPDEDSGVALKLTVLVNEGYPRRFDPRKGFQLPLAAHWVSSRMHQFQDNFAVDGMHCGKDFLLATRREGL